MFDNLHKAFSRIESLEDEEWELIKSRFHEVEFKKKEHLLSLGKIANSFFFINEGLVRLYGYKNGEEKTLFFFKEGMMAGSIKSYRREQPTNLILEAIEPTKALRIDRPDLEELYYSSPKMARLSVRIYQQRLEQILQFFSSFVLDTPEERYKNFLKKEPDLLNRVPQHIIASFLGVTPVSLSRIRTRMLHKS